MLLPLGLAVLASVATSPARDDVILNLAVYQRHLYARAIDAGISLGDGFYARYLTDENRWVELGAVSNDVGLQLADEVALPVKACARNADDRCYRIEGDHRVYASEDGGETWVVEWEFPENRLTFAERIREGYASVEDMGPFDLAILPAAGDDFFVAVAMGSEGVLMRQPDGSWQRQVVMEAEPTSFAASRFDQITGATMSESVTLLVVALLYAHLLSFAVWRKVIALLPSIVMSTLAVFFLVNFALPFPLEGTLVVGSSALTLVLSVLALAMKWDSYLTRMGDRKPAVQAWRVWLFSTLALFFSGGIPFILWALGTIPDYQTATWLAAVLAGAIILSGAYQSLKLMAAARREPLAPNIGN